MLPLIRNLEEERDKSGTRCHRTGKSQTYRLSVFWLIVKAESVPIDWMHGYHCGGMIRYGMQEQKDCKTMAYLGGFPI